MNIFSKVFGTRSEHEVKRIMPLVEKTEALRPEMQKLTDEQLRDKTREFRKRLDEGATLDDLLPEAFAVVREGAKRVLGMEHYRVQIIGGIILHQGRIAEMKTGEGKTLVSTLPAYLNALEGKGVHIVTVNDYLAKRDAEWMGKVHEFLGLTVGVVLNDMKPEERRAAYGCDITYITNNELGFDYLRDNMVIYKEQLVQRDLHYCIIDEIDSVLIDEARTPLIISGQSGKSTKLYEVCDILAPIIPIYGYMDSGRIRYSTTNRAHPTMLNIPLFPTRPIQSSVNGRHTDIQAIPAHIALGSPRRFIKSIALETIRVSLRYHLPRAECRSNSRNRSRKVLLYGRFFWFL